MEIQQIRFGIFLGIFLVMLALESIIQRHPTLDSKKNRLGINLALTGIDILAVRFVFGTAAVGAAQFAEERGWGLFNFMEWWAGLEVIAVIIILDFMIYIQHVLVHVIPFFWQFHVVHHSDLDLDLAVNTLELVQK